MAKDAIADAIEYAFVSPNVSDRNMEPANIVDVIQSLSTSIYKLGNADASTNMGGLEAHGKALLDSAQILADAINNLADQIRDAKQ
jgi:hypothetical protein